jgi:transcriptional regulator with XRE-family HTH domain
MDYDALAAGLIRRVRGAMSTHRLSRQLGFSSNVLQLWERQQRLPCVGTFFRMVAARKLAITAGLAALLDTLPHTAPLPRASAGANLDVSNVMRLLSRQRSASELARLSGFDRATIGRWCDGKTRPRLPDFLAYLDTTTQRLLDFVALFADPRDFEPTRVAYEEHQKRQRIAYALPWSSALLHALELSAYRALASHDARLLAQKLGLATAEVERLLQHLAEARLVEVDSGLYRPARILTVHTQRDFAANRRVKRHWAAVTNERLERFQPDHQSLYSYNVFPIGDAELVQLRQLHLDYYQRVRALVASATSADHVVVMNVQLCLLDETAG